MCRYIISHRLRGFDAHDATHEALIRALDSGIAAIEVDTRITADNVIVLNHDANLSAHFKSAESISNIQFEFLKNISYKFRQCRILALHELLSMMNVHRNRQCVLFLDIKETGYEAQIVSLLATFGMISRTVIVSWLPEVLQKIYVCNNSIPLCFSHYKVSGRFSACMLQTIITAKEMFSGKPVLTKILTEAYNKADNIKTENSYGIDYEHIAVPYVRGELLELLRKTEGMICVPYQSLRNEDVAYYATFGIKSVVFSIDEREILDHYIKTVCPDYILSNNPDLCTRISY